MARNVCVRKDGKPPQAWQALMDPNHSNTKRTESGLRILAIAKLHHAFANHYQPLADSGRVSAVTALRPLKWTKSHLSGINIIHYQRWPLPVSLVVMLITAIRKMKTGEFDAIVAFSPVPYGLIGLIAGRASGKPVHVGVIGENVSPKPGSLLRPLARHVLARAKTISVVGANTRQRLLPMVSDTHRIFVLPHGVTREFYPDWKIQKIYDALFVGDLLPVKRVDFIIRTWRRVVTRRPDSRLCIVGDGPERKKLESLARSLDLKGDIDFVGYQRHVAGFYRRSQLLLMASETEGLPFALIEAMACGVVPITNNAGDIKTLIVNNHNGILLDKSATASDYSKNIQEVLAQVSILHRLRSAALSSVKHLDSAEVTQAWNLILTRLVDSA